jgi:hypothetical protein
VLYGCVISVGIVMMRGVACTAVWGTVFAEWRVGIVMMRGVACTAARIYEHFVTTEGWLYVAFPLS